MKPFSERTARVIGEARENWGTVSLIASHDLQWLDGVCGRRILMRRGKIESISA